MARKYVGVGGFSNNSEIEYDLDTHVASRAGYRMFKVSLPISFEI